jgi:hypothetical protein
MQSGHVTGLLHGSLCKVPAAQPLAEMEPGLAYRNDRKLYQTAWAHLPRSPHVCCDISGIAAAASYFADKKFPALFR